MRNIEPAPLSALADLPATTDIPTAGRFFGLGREGSYRLHAAGGFPVRTLTLGSRHVVLKTDLCRALGVPLGEADATDAQSPLAEVADR